MKLNWDSPVYELLFWIFRRSLLTVKVLFLMKAKSRIDFFMYKQNHGQKYAVCWWNLFLSFNKERFLDKKNKIKQECVLQRIDDLCCSALEECCWGFASQAEKCQKFKYLTSMTIHNHCQFMWPSALGCNEQLIMWRDGYIYMFWFCSVLSSPEPSWQQCQMQTCTLNHRLLQPLWAYLFEYGALLQQ